jgi:hypothetical protein
MDRLDKHFPLAYSPLFTGFAAGWCGLFALCGLTVVSPVAGWIWLAVLAVSALGILLQFTTKRVLVMRAYDSVVLAMAAVAGAVWTWEVLTLAWGEGSGVYAGTLIALMLISFGAMVYVRDRSNPKRVRLPCATIGKLDPNTGLIVDPRYIERTPETKLQGSVALRRILSATPLIAGISLMLVRGLPDEVAMLLFLLPSMFIAIFMTWISAVSMSFLIGTIHWEREHGKRIYVKR